MWLRVCNFISLGVMLGLTGCITPISVALDGQLTSSKPIEAAIRADLSPQNSPEPLHSVILPGSAGAQRVAIIELDGLLVQESLVGLGSQGSNPVALFHEKLQAAENDPAVVGVVLRINSPGGTVGGSDLIANEIRRFRERTTKRVVAHTGYRVDHLAPIGKGDKFVTGSDDRERGFTEPCGRIRVPNPFRVKVDKGLGGVRLWRTFR